MRLAKQLLTSVSSVLLSIASYNAHAASPATDSWQEGGATVSIIIDDVGHSRRYGEAILNLDDRLTLAILPFTPFSQYFSDKGRAAGNEIMLHLPMESISNKNASDTQLQVDMKRDAFEHMLARNLGAFEGFTGINNHQGSRMMQDSMRLGWLMESIADDNMFFVDSKTVGRSPATSIASSKGIPTVGRDIFLDDTADEADIKRQFDRMIKLALRDGHAVAIGHPRPNTINVLRREMPRLKALNIKVVPVTTTIALASGGTMLAGLAEETPDEIAVASTKSSSLSIRNKPAVTGKWKLNSFRNATRMSFSGQ